MTIPWAEDRRRPGALMPGLIRPYGHLLPAYRIARPRPRSSLGSEAEPVGAARTFVSMSRMLEILRDLIAHKGHADAALLSAIRQNVRAASDLELRDILHHVLIANRFWLLTVVGRPFDHDAEARPSPSFEALIQRYGSTHAQETTWLAAATEPDLTRVLEDSRIPNGQCSVAQALMQACLHSHGHRAQCAKLLRQLGGVPPPTDFILWLTTRPAAEWVAV
jgi:uncharacterized damage-inducible protein DinB